MIRPIVADSIRMGPDDGRKEAGEQDGVEEECTGCHSEAPGV